jgi:uncharacterized membrane protein YhaH (DUF805 family)
MNLVRLFFSFSGRVNRAGYWLVSIFWLVAAGVLNVTWNPFDAPDFQFGRDHRVDAALVLIVFVTIASCVAVCIRRLHDRDKSAWWLLLYGLAPAVLQTIAAINDLDAALMVMLMVFAGAISIWAFIDVGCLRGTYGTNRYGPDPLAGV